jgi:deoxyribodipyrimidine photolyase-related protein
MTTLYWNFLDQHEASFEKNPRTALMVKNLQRLSTQERSEISVRATSMLADLDSL